MTEHLAFDQLQTIDLSFGLSVAPETVQNVGSSALCVESDPSGRVIAVAAAITILENE